MTPFHPKLRRALLRDPKHKERGLTAEGLLYFEGLIAKRYYLEKYKPLEGQDTSEQTKNPKPEPPAEQEPIDKIIEDFRNQYMPNFDKIHQEWVKGQKKAIKSRYHDLNPGRLIKDAFVLLWAWVLAVIFRRKRDYEKLG